MITVAMNVRIQKPQTSNSDTETFYHISSYSEQDNEVSKNENTLWVDWLSDNYI